MEFKFVTVIWKLTNFLLGGISVKHIDRGRISPLQIVTHIKNILFEVFLPRGYPDSVSDDYIYYQLWDTLQACCSTFSGMLAVQAVLKGVGVGSETSTPLAAAITWFTKDGIGMISGIMFAWLKGSYLDSDCKKWRLFADVVNDTALCMELSIAGLLDQTLPILCFSSALKALVGVAGGATRAALTHHQAARGNTADVAAKDGSQETLVNLAAMSIGITLLHTSFVQSYSWFVMAILVILHILCNYKAVKSLRLRKLNESRYLILIREYIRTQQVPSVEYVNFEESVILGRGYSFQHFSGFSISIGRSLRKSLSSQIIGTPSVDSNYLVAANVSEMTISTFLRPEVSDSQVLESYFVSAMVALKLKSVLDSTGNNFNPSEFPLDTYKQMFNAFRSDCEKIGWNMTESVFYTEQCRVDWATNKDN